MTLYEYRLIRASLIYLVLTALLGVLFYLSPILMAYFRTTHIHLGVVGFFLSMVMGVAYWMMPRPGGLRQDRLEAVTFYLLNAGLVLRFFSEPLWRYTGEGWLQAPVVLSGMLQFAAIVTFAYAMQARVVTADMLRQLREAREAKEKKPGPT